MKIMHVINSITHSSIPLELAERMAREHEVTVVSFYDSRKKVENLKGMMKLSATVAGCSMRKGLNLRGYAALYRLIRRTAPQIVHTHHTLSGAVARLMARRLGGITVVHTVHANHRSYGFFQNLIVGLTLPLCDVVICNSENTSRSIRPWQKALLGKRERRVVYNGVDIDRIRARLEADLKLEPGQEEFLRGRFVFGTVGRIMPVKDHLTLLRAFLEVRKTRPDVRLLLVGDGELRREVEKEAARRGGSDAVLITGMVPRDAVYTLLRRIDVFVISSRYEGFCNAMVEAMIAARPVVATDVAPLPEVLGRECGLFFRRGDWRELAERMAELHDDAGKRRALGEKARRRAESRFSLNATVASYLSIYRFHASGS